MASYSNASFEMDGTKTPAPEANGPQQQAPPYYPQQPNPYPPQQPYQQQPYQQQPYQQHPYQQNQPQMYPPSNSGPNYYPPPTPQQQYQSPQQQQQQVVIVNGQPQPQVVVVPNNTVSFCGYITLSCFVFWCCGWIFGLIAFILAMVAQDRASTGNHEEARQLGRASLGVSIAGIVIGCIIIAVAVGLSVSSGQYNNSNTQTYYYGK